MSHRCWFWQDGFKFMPEADGVTVHPGGQPTDASAAGGSWREDGDTITFAPSWCRRVFMRECRRYTFPDGTPEVQSGSVEVEW